MMKWIFLLTLVCSFAWGAYSPQTIITDPAGVNQANVKAASTAAAATDKAVVVAISPNNTVGVTASGTWNLGRTWSLSSGTDSVAVTGTFWQATQPVSGTFWQATQPVSIASMPSTPVIGTFWQATQPVSGTFWQATQPVSISSMPSTPVTGTFWQATQPMSAAQLPATLGQGTMAQSMRVVLPTDQSEVPTVPHANVNGTQVTGTVSTVITLTAPANSVGFILQAADTNTTNMRWAVGATATTSVGQQLQPGRDVSVNVGANVSIVSESGTNEYEIQWVVK